MTNIVDEQGIRNLAKDYVVNIVLAIVAIIAIFLIFGFTFGTGSFSFLFLLIPVLPFGIVFYLRMLKSKDKFYNKITIHVKKDVPAPVEDEPKTEEL